MVNEFGIDIQSNPRPEHVDTNIRFRQLLDSLPVTVEIKNILDVGCGLGVIGRTLTGKYGGEYHGVDVSEFLIDEARKALGGENQQIKFYCGDATELDRIPSLPPEFEMVLSRHPQIKYGSKMTFEKIYEAAFARLTNGGAFLVTTLIKNEYRNARNMLKKLGLEILQKNCGINPYSNGREDKYVLLGIKS